MGDAFEGAAVSSRAHMARAFLVTRQAVTDAILLLATALQVAAALVALLLLPASKKRVVWLVLTAALVMQAWRRLYPVLAANPSPQHDAVTAIAASLLMLASVVAIRSLLLSHQKATDELSLAHATAELYLDVTGAIIVVMDAEGRFMQVNQKGRDILGLEDEHIDIGVWFSTLPRSDIRDELAAGFRAFMTGESGDDQYLEYPLVTPRGEERHIFWHRHLVRDENGCVSGIVSAGMDMTKRRAAEREAAFRSQLLDRTSDAIIVTDTADYGTIVYANDAACSMVHATRNQLAGANVRQFLQGEWLNVLEQRQRRLREEGSVFGQIEVEVGENEPAPVEVHSHVVEADGRQLVVSVLRDIRERKRAEATIRHMAYHDALTGLPNRALFEDRAEMALAHARRHGERLALLFLDVDGLKLVNDTHGHAVADRMLCRLAERLSSAFRAEDTIARIGGDEFAILLPATDPDTARTTADKALSEMQRPFKVSGKEVWTSVSIGASVFPTDGESLDDLLASADAAMYRTKARGGNGLSFFTTDMKQEMLDVLTLRHDLCIGIERGEFVLHYQPQIRMSTGEIVGGEALVRWNHPERGMLAPVDFINLAEETGAIEPIGTWVLEEACSEAQRWTEAGGRPLRIAVNVSARQFRDVGFVSVIDDVLGRTGLEPSRLQLEITETAAMEDPEIAIEVLCGVTNLGVTIAIDDFGTGHSSMAYLKRLPVSAIKIDRVFIADLDADEEGQLLVSTIVGLAQSLGLGIIAEGVERSEQVALLRTLGCDHAQGFLYHPPMPADEFLKLLEANESRRGVHTGAQLEADGAIEPV